MLSGKKSGIKNIMTFVLAVLLLISSCAPPETLKTEAPVFDPQDGSTLDEGEVITITCPDSSAIIYYTINGSTQTYSAPLHINESCTITAYAQAGGKLPSDEVTASYTVKNTEQVAAPTFSPDTDTIPFLSDNLKVKSATEGATFYYTLDGNYPTETSKEAVNGIINLSEVESKDEVPVKVIAIKDGFTASEIAEKNFTKASVDLEFSTEQTEIPFNADTLKVVTSIEGATIKYSIDDGNEITTEDGVIDLSAVSIETDKISITVTATAAGYKQAILTREFSRSAKIDIKFESKGNTIPFLDNQLKVTSLYSNAEFYYTLDSTDPTDSSRKAENGFIRLSEITDDTVTVKAIAYVGNQYSDVILSEFTKASADIALTHANNSTVPFLTGFVSASSTTDGAKITYTLNDGTPQDLNNNYIDLSSVTNDSVKVTATATATGYKNSSLSATYNKATAPAPEIKTESSFMEGTANAITITAADGATISYRIDGNGWNNYSGPFTVDTYGDYTVEAFTTLKGYKDSETISNAIIVMRYLSTPVRSIPRDNTPFTESMQVAFLNMNEDATIYYTTDGSYPTNKSEEYKGPITPSIGSTLKVVAIDNAGFGSSGIVELKFNKTDADTSYVTERPWKNVYQTATFNDDGTAVLDMADLGTVSFQYAYSAGPNLLAYFDGEAATKLTMTIPQTVYNSTEDTLYIPDTSTTLERKEGKKGSINGKWQGYSQKAGNYFYNISDEGIIYTLIQQGVEYRIFAEGSQKDTTGTKAVINTPAYLFIDKNAIDSTLDKATTLSSSFYREPLAPEISPKDGSFEIGDVINIEITTMDTRPGITTYYLINGLEAGHHIQEQTEYKGSFSYTLEEGVHLTAFSTLGSGLQTITGAFKTEKYLALERSPAPFVWPYTILTDGTSPVEITLTDMTAGNKSLQYTINSTAHDYISPFSIGKITEPITLTVKTKADESGLESESVEMTYFPGNDASIIAGNWTTTLSGTALPVTIAQDGSVSITGTNTEIGHILYNQEMNLAVFSSTYSAASLWHTYTFKDITAEGSSYRTILLDSDTKTTLNAIWTKDNTSLIGWWKGEENMLSSSVNYNAVLYPEIVFYEDGGYKATLRYNDQYLISEGAVEEISSGDTHKLTPDSYYAIAENAVTDGTLNIALLTLTRTE